MSSTDRGYSPLFLPFGCLELANKVVLYDCLSRIRHGVLLVLSCIFI